MIVAMLQKYLNLAVPLAMIHATCPTKICVHQPNKTLNYGQHTLGDMLRGHEVGSQAPSCVLHRTNVAGTVRNLVQIIQTEA